MENILARVKKGQFWQAPGGIHPPTRKVQTNSKHIATLPLAEHYYVPVKQHIGDGGDIIVNVGDKVLGGQAMSRSLSPLSVPVHAPTSGKIVEICQHISAHPSQLPTTTIKIQADGKDKQQPLTDLGDWQQCLPNAILHRIGEAGISGLGGAGFPTQVKLSGDGDLEFLIINAVECEPYITADDLLIQEKAEQILEGIDILAKLLAPQHILIGIENDKPIATSTLRAVTAKRSDITVCEIPTLYPSGGEKQLIQILTGREVPHQGLPRDIGIVMHNVGTVFAIQQAVCENKPLIERVVTLTGDALTSPQNVWAKIGTPVAHALAFAGYTPTAPKRLIMGGPMMGFALSSEDVPIVKITNCILAPSFAELPESGPEMPCIRCGACADACPASLLPQQLLWYSQAADHDKLKDYNIFDCIECGVCSAVCPSNIPLVNYYRIAKADIRETELEAQKAEQARLRFEARQERLEREKLARQEKHRLAAAAREKAMSERDKNANKDAVAAALERVKKNKQGADESVNDSKSRAQAAIARAKAKQQAQKTEVEPDNSAVIIEREKRKQLARERKAKKSQSDDSQSLGNENTDSSAVTADTKKAAVAAAIARAKAKKAAVTAPNLDSDTESPASSTLKSEANSRTDSAPSMQHSESKSATSTDKQAKIAAAIARAKAKKQLDEEQASKDSEDLPANKVEAETDKKAKVSAAIAKAKARKAAEQRTNSEQEQALQDQAEQKKAKVAAAIARAKAKKLEQQDPN